MIYKNNNQESQGKESPWMGPDRSRTLAVWCQDGLPIYNISNKWN